MEARARRAVEKGAKTDRLELMKKRNRDGLTSGVWRPRSSVRTRWPCA
jgi:hypothetical protein